MAFDLVLTEEAPQVASAAAADDPKIGESKGVGRRFFAALPEDYKVFLLYYRAGMADEELEDKLVELGRNTGKNLFVNIGSARDLSYAMICKRFELKQFPVIIMTATPDLASPGDEYLTTYAKLDSKQLLSSPEKTIACVEKLFHLFLQGEVAKAASSARSAQRTERMSAVAHLLGNALKTIGGFIASRDISVSVLEGKLELKRSGG